MTPNKQFNTYKEGLDLEFLLVGVELLIWCHCCHCSLNFGYKGSHFSSQTVSFCYKAIRI